MNLLKKFIRDNADVEAEEYEDLYIDPEDMQENLDATEAEDVAKVPD